MILAAGRGERMRPLTDHTPKPLLEVGGKSLIVWHLEELKRAGFKEVIINHAYLGNQIEEALGDGSDWGLNILYSPENTALETAGGIANALALIGEDPFLLVNGDIFTQFNLSSLTLKNNNLAHLVMVTNPSWHPNGDFVLREGYLVPGQGNRLTYSGVGVYHPKMFRHIPPGTVAKLAPLIQLAIEKGLVSAEHYQGIWSDIGTPERLAQMNEALFRT
jgi:N-acetyl-alpha-D-muramate 1-phosphate uridylyltransferase